MGRMRLLINGQPRSVGYGNLAPADILHIGCS